MTEPPGESAEACAVDGLLEELGRAGPGHDERFVSGVLTRVKAQSGLAVTRGVTAKFSVGGGDGISHSRPEAPHGLGPATAPYFSDHKRYSTGST